MVVNMDIFTGSDSNPPLIPSDTRIFCGHEYTLSNFNFLVKASPPDQEEILNKFE
jgi:hypothetical protein